jgi:hypothetical protein
MPALETTPPEAGTYAFVLRRYDRALLEHAIAVAMYTRVHESRWIEVDGQGAHTLFVQEESERDYAIRRGWLDETDKWKAHLADKEDEPKVRASLAALASPSVASAVAKSAGISPASALRILSRLETAGEAVRRGSGSIVLWSAPAKPAAPSPEGVRERVGR